MAGRLFYMGGQMNYFIKDFIKGFMDMWPDANNLGTIAAVLVLLLIMSLGVAALICAVHFLVTFGGK